MLELPVTPEVEVEVEVEQQTLETTGQEEQEEQAESRLRGVQLHSRGFRCLFLQPAVTSCWTSLQIRILQVEFRLMLLLHLPQMG
jgi:hypothetical protein